MAMQMAAIASALGSMDRRHQRGVVQVLHRKRSPTSEPVVDMQHVERSPFFGDPDRRRRQRPVGMFDIIVEMIGPWFSDNHPVYRRSIDSYDRRRLVKTGRDDVKFQLCIQRPHGRQQFFDMLAQTAVDIWRIFPGKHHCFHVRHFPFLLPDSVLVDRFVHSLTASGKLATGFPAYHIDRALPTIVAKL